MQNENRLQDVSNPNVSIVQKCQNGVLRIIRETKNTTGEIPNPENSEETIETITITRKEIQQTS